YAIAIGDCNNNGVLDACEILNNLATDCNANGVPDTCDIANGVLSDLDSNNIPDECDCNLFACPGDTDYDANVTGTDLHNFLSCIVNHDMTQFGCPCADMNGDLKLTAADIPPFISKSLTDPDPLCP